MKNQDKQLITRESSRSPPVASVQLLARMFRHHPKTRTRRHEAPRSIALSSFSVIPAILLIFLILITSEPERSPRASLVSDAFHLSFGHKLLKTRQAHSSPQMQLNPASSLIRPIECRNANNQSEAGICMFSIDCMHNKGTPLSICKHNYFVGTCCKLPDHNNFVGIVYDLRETEAAQAAQLAARLDLLTRAPASETGAPSSSGTVAPAADKQAEQTFAVSLSPSQPASESEWPQNRGTPTTGGPLPSTARTLQQHFESTSAAPEASSVAPGGVSASLIEEMYMISSTSLFPASQTTTTKGPVAALESARNADGSATVTSGESKASAVLAYELVRDELASQQQQQNQSAALEQQTIMSSAHSPPASSHGQQAAAAAAVRQPEEQRVTIVFANNHGPSLSSAAPSAASVASNSSQTELLQASSSKQEFTLASEQTQAATSAPPGGAQSSPLYDLISSPAGSSSAQETLAASSQLQVQTTTPFTSSLSTALLPNVSSHVFVQTSTSPAPSSAASQTTTAQPQQTTLVSQQQQQATSSSGGSAPSSSRAPVLFASTEQVKLQQLALTYSSQHAAASRPPLFAAAPTLQAASSKIVSSSSSAANNLIPGLSGLQSAILSHIPFKIASGLSSYLQAAMKPTIGGGRPLISSNTAPALQFQAGANATGAFTRAPSVAPTSSSGGTTPAGSTTSGHASQATKLEGGASALLAAAPSAFAGALHSNGSARDVLREAQLICGRPQVATDYGKKRVARIVGGNQSLFGQWPWMVSLRQWRKGAFLHKCGAALLNENWAITAAHCVENVKASDLLLRLGEFDVSNQNEPFPYIERRVKTVVSHHSFDPKTFEYDLALLKFAEPIQYERNIIPVCVPHGNDSYVDRIATVIGWGRLYEDGPLPDVIQHVDVPIIANDECEKMYKNAGYVEEIPEMFICAGINKGGRDSCEGDSGGPLTMVDYDGRSYLVGIISWGIGCALPSQPGVYTRITAFKDWINQITVA